MGKKEQYCTVNARKFFAGFLSVQRPYFYQQQNINGNNVYVYIYASFT